MDVTQFTSTPTCYGLKGNGDRCTRTKLQPNGYCFQHQAQAEKGKEEEISSSSSDASQSSSSDSSEDAVHQEPAGHRPISPPPPMPMPEFDQDDGQQLVLHQCEAIAKSTKQQCRKLVSFADETHCPAHGGRQKAPLPALLPQCQAITSSTRRQCQHTVSVAGETHCPAHGGRSKKNMRTHDVTANDTRNPSNEITSTLPWSHICATSIRYLLHEHGEVPCHQCNLDDQPCPPLAVVVLFQRLAEQLLTDDMDDIREWLAQQLSEYSESRVLELLLAAQRLFGTEVGRVLLSALITIDD